MSTRCHIGFYGNATQELSTPSALIYRHSDGYPDTEHGVVSALLPWMQRFHDERGLEDAEYAAARGLVALILSTGSIDGTLGYGICGDHALHGDHEYYYRVDPSGLSVYEAHGEAWTDLALLTKHALNT